MNGGLRVKKNCTCKGYCAQLQVGAGWHYGQRRLAAGAEAGADADGYLDADVGTTVGDPDIQDKEDSADRDNNEQDPGMT